MAYPSAPWTLRGYALQTVQLIDIERVRPLIPKEFEIVSVFPGKTIGGVYLSNYGPGSVLEYSELIVVAGLVRYTSRVGGWISHIYVDNADSVEGGREIWGLPKQMADFTWKDSDRTTSGYNKRVIVRQGEQTLCRLSYHPQNFGLPLPFSGDVFSTELASILLFKGELQAQVGLVSSEVQVPVGSPFATLGLEQPWLTFHCDQLRLVAGTPEVVGRQEAAFSY